MKSTYLKKKKGCCHGFSGTPGNRTLISCWNCFFLTASMDTAMHHALHPIISPSFPPQLEMLRIDSAADKKAKDALRIGTQGVEPWPAAYYDLRLFSIIAAVHHTPHPIHLFSFPPRHTYQLLRITSVWKKYRTGPIGKAGNRTLLAHFI
jgi:hypothetical protein